MKKWMENEMSLEDFKKTISSLQEKDDKKEFYVFIGICVVLLAAIIAGVAYLVKRKLDKDAIEAWEDEWDDEDWDYEDCECVEGDCCCTDADVDKSVVVEKL